MVMSHTPGPWLAKPKAGEIILNASNCYAVQEVYSPQGGHNPADITLMAAAPDLLAACQSALDYFNETRSGREWRDNGGNEPDLLRSAVAKAKGRGK
jgi:hypothetical protein